MKRHLLTAVAAIALISGIGSASAAGNSGSAPSNSSMASPSSSAAQSTASDSLHLSSAQEKTVWTDISKEGSKQTAPSNFTPSVGATLPASMKVQSVPSDVAQQIPQLKPYDYVLLQNKLLIVNPLDKKIVDVISQQA